MKKIITAASLLMLINACGPNNNAPNFTNSCCCNTMASAGNAKVFVPSAFSPNTDGVNDVLNFMPNNAVKYITNVVIKDAQSNTIKTIDTAFISGSISTGWDGKLNSGIIHEGVFTINFTIIDTANVITNISNQNSCSYICSNTNAQINNKASCKLSDMYDPVTGMASFTTSDPCFK